MIPERTVVLRCRPVRWPTVRLALDQAGGDERPMVDPPDDLLLPGVVLHDVLAARIGRGRGLPLGCSLSGARVTGNKIVRVLIMTGVNVRLVSVSRSASVQSRRASDGYA
jgi:hypothetical protein